MSAIVFLLVAALTIACALLVILHKSPVYSAIGLVGALAMIAVLFLGLDAQIVGFLQIIVYAGAIVVLFLFVIMLLNLQEQPETFSPASLVGFGLAGGIGFAAIVAVGLARAPLESRPAGEGFGGTVMLAERLFTRHLLPFELTSVLLLVAIIGAVVLGKKRLP